MNEKEISEIRRRFRADKSNITHVRGCYVNEKQEIVSQFDQPLSLLPQEECENMLSVLRRTLSGTLGKNLIEISFTTAQVIDSDEHRLLMALRDSKLTDEEAVRMFFEKVIASYRPEGTYLILLANDTYDVPYRAKDGETLEDASENIYNYVLCTVCPVKQTKPVLGYDVPENTFHNRDIGLGGVVTFKNARHSVEVAKAIPLDRLLTETDAPYMAPVPFRGKRCDSSMIPYDAAKIAEVRGITAQEVLETACENACRLFGITLPSAAK